MRGTRWQGACFKAFPMAFNLLIKTQTSIKCQLNCRRQWREDILPFFRVIGESPRINLTSGGIAAAATAAVPCESCSLQAPQEPHRDPAVPPGCPRSAGGNTIPKKHAKTSQAMHSPSPHVPLLTWVRMRLQSTAANEIFCTSKNSFLQLINGWKNTTQANCIQLSSSQ